MISNLDYQGKCTSMRNNFGPKQLCGESTLEHLSTSVLPKKSVEEREFFSDELLKCALLKSHPDCVMMLRVYEKNQKTSAICEYFCRQMRHRTLQVGTRYACVEHTRIPRFCHKAMINVVPVVVLFRGGQRRYVFQGVDPLGKESDAVFLAIKRLQEESREMAGILVNPPEFDLRHCDDENLKFQKKFEKAFDPLESLNDPFHLANYDPCANKAEGRHRGVCDAALNIKSMSGKPYYS